MEGNTNGVNQKSVTYCAKCGTQNSIDCSFCSECGAPLATNKANTYSNNNTQQNVTQKKKSGMSVFLVFLVCIFAMPLLLSIILFGFCFAALGGL